ncbi:MAG: bifunctional precorrin-2 dehydrogenase/sirohydrochlorin ferrochelatase [Candidatus Bathyarchaeota archaeon]|nr:bifunctional precorrin-2 dehydrogenase/sirohydrochlorin ferrochelatase [Candidatus Bathyarchaeota archaeon]
MLINLKLDDKTILIFGGGSIGERKTKKFLHTNSKVMILGKDFTSELKKISKSHNIELKQIDLKKNFSSIIPLIAKSDIVIAALDDSLLNKRISSEAGKKNILVNVVDDPTLSDFYVPATTSIGEIDVAISTDGKSPAMAGILRKKIIKCITTEEILQVGLQDYARKLLKNCDFDRETRREILYKIIQNSRIKQLLKEEKLDEAKDLVNKIIKNNQKI